MGKRDSVIIEDTELKPQVIGHTYKKKSNIGRFIFMLIVFIVAIYYINDISVYINNLLGRKSAETIQKIADDNKEKRNNKNNKNNNVKTEVVFYELKDSLEIETNNLSLNNFAYENGMISFDANNNTNSSINLSSKKLFLETFNESKTLLERIKLDINEINSSDKVSYSFDLKNDFKYFTIEEKSIDDYPAYTLTYDESGSSSITCTKDVEKIVYNFKSDELVSINHYAEESDTSSQGYYTNLSLYQNKSKIYDNIEGIDATFTSNLAGYKMNIKIDLANANLSLLDEKYYYAYKEIPKVVHFEMQTYGFTCS